MLEMYEGLRAVCAVLRELEPCTARAPALRLAERHLSLLARLAAGHLEGEPGGPGAPGGPHGPVGPGAIGLCGLPLRAWEEVSHVVQ